MSFRQTRTGAHERRRRVTLCPTAYVLHPDYAPPPSKTDTHFTVRRQCIETRSCCGGGCRWGM
eukprot:5734893-Prymnesium_polylepis.1